MILNTRVRGLAMAMLDSNAHPTPEAVKALATEAQQLCDHVDRVHEEMTRIFDAMSESGDALASTKQHDRDIDLAAVEIQRETHELKADPLDILKALLMWRDDPADRIQRRT